MWLTDPKEIKFHVKKWINANAEELKGKNVLDFPAGNGVSSKELIAVGAKVSALDLIPELFRVDGLECKHADLGEHLPLPNNYFDYILCQEGIEHVADQLKAFKELSRVLKSGGRLLLTTPNYSNIRSRLSYMLCESELFGKIMPPNEIDSIWLAPQQSNQIYFGHIYLLGIQKLRTLAKLAGFKIRKIIPTKINLTSLLFFIFLYPFIFYFSWAAYKRTLRKNGKKNQAIYREVFYYSVSPLLLLDNHFVIELEKDQTFKPPTSTVAEVFVT